jgi:hypothetical protein
MGIVRRIEQAEILTVPVYPDLDHELLLMGIHTHRQIVFTITLLMHMICRIDHTCHRSQILPTIVQALAINVIRLHTIRRIQNDPVHAYQPWPRTIGLTTITNGVERSSTAMGVPLPLTQELKVLVINQSVQTLSECNAFHVMLLFSDTGKMVQAWPALLPWR